MIAGNVKYCQEKQTGSRQQTRLVGLLENRQADREGFSEEMTTEQGRRGEGCSGKSQLCTDLRGVASQREEQVQRP